MCNSLSTYTGYSVTLATLPMLWLCFKPGRRACHHQTRFTLKGQSDFVHLNAIFTIRSFQFNIKLINRSTPTVTMMMIDDVDIFWYQLFEAHVSYITDLFTLMHSLDANTITPKEISDKIIIKTKQMSLFCWNS